MVAMNARYIARFTGRQAGAIGVFHACMAIVLAPDPVSAHENRDSILEKARLELYAAYEHIQGLTLTAYNGGLYEAVQLLGIEHDNHESDLYLPATKQVQLLLRAFEITTAKPFRHTVKGVLWYDVPFMYSPWWEARQR